MSHVFHVPLSQPCACVLDISAKAAFLLFIVSGIIASRLFLVKAHTVNTTPGSVGLLTQTWLLEAARNWISLWPQAAAQIMDIDMDFGNYHGPWPSTQSVPSPKAMLMSMSLAAAVCHTDLSGPHCHQRLWSCPGLLMTMFGSMVLL